MKSVGVKLAYILALFTGILWAQVSPYDVTKKDYKPRAELVHDFGGILNLAQKNKLEQKLEAYDDSTSVQIVIVTFRKLESYPIELLANEIGQNWGVGQKGKENGIVIVLSKEDRKVTIRGGYGIQSKMPPTIEKLIIDREMIPQFKQGDYYRGLDNGVNMIQEVLSGQYDADSKNTSDTDAFWVYIIFLGIIFLFVIIANKGNGGGGGNRQRRGMDIGDIILMNSGRRTWSGGGSSWGGSSGGGFGGFGGGSFGGGGASGSW